MDLDVTYFIQLGIFLTCLVTLNGLIIQPFLKVIMEREAQTEGAQEQVAGLTAQGDTDMDAYQLRMREARGVASKAREALREEGRAQERQLLADLRAEVADTLNKTRAEVATAEEQARSQLGADTDAMARELVQKILGRELAA